jgi:hypothetical protein
MAATATTSKPATGGDTQLPLVVSFKTQAADDEARERQLAAMAKLIARAEEVARR